MAEWKKITHTLAYPITVGEGSKAQEITEITMAEPDGEAVEMMQDAGVFNGVDPEAAKAGGNQKLSLTARQMRVCISALSKVPEDTIKRLHYRDITAIGEALGPLFEGLET